MKGNKLLNILCYTLICTIIIVLLIIAYNNFALKEEEILNKGESLMTYSVLFSLNGADSIDKNLIRCEVINNSCMIVLPNAKRNDGEVLGYNLSPNDTSAKYMMGESISISGNMTLYVISTKKNSVYIEEENVDYLEKNLLECSVYNQENNCSVTLPSFNKIGYVNMGYSTSENSLIGFIYPNEEYKISRNVTLYPIYGTSDHLISLNIANVLNYHNSIVEIENGCKDSVYNNYLQYLDGINNNAPFLMIGSKISFVTDDTFNKIWGNGYVGMNYGPKNLRSLDVRCSQKVLNDYYGTMVHELSHSWDFYYSTKMGGNITSQNDIINLYNKYIKLNPRPFRDYSYSSIYEFQADMMKYYYFKYLVPRSGYKDLDYPEDIKKTIEKYICISKNNYDESKCS